MSTAQVVTDFPSVARRSRESLQPERDLATLTNQLAANGIEGVRAVLRDWCDTGENDLAAVTLLLADRVAELLAEQHDRTSLAEANPTFSAERDDYCYTNSTHFSLLTAAILRQRSQIAELMTLVDKLSRRLG